jgi:hypothetical protein
VRYTVHACGFSVSEIESIIIIVIIVTIIIYHNKQHVENEALVFYGHSSFIQVDTAYYDLIASNVLLQWFSLESLLHK